jgi:FMN phosphatase YigB (HAD superfamily)
MKDLAFLIDVDNTLIDNDKVKADLVERIEGVVGKQHGTAFWRIYEDVRRDLDYVDLPQTLSRFKSRYPDERGFPMLAAMVLFYPFESCLFPAAPDVVAHLKSMGAVAILSDGDPVFQPAKIARAGLYDAVDGKVLVYPHKEDHLQDVQRRVPARRYVVIDDKPNVLSVMRRRLKGKGTSVHVCQGKYALASQPHDYPDPDIQVQQISELLDYKTF